MTSESPKVASRLQELLREDEEDKSAQNGNTSKVHEDTPLKPSPIGNALESMMNAYTEIITLANINAPVQASTTAEHVKEITELHIKKWRDSCLDMITELSRTGMQWELSYPHEKHKEQLEDITRAVERQKRLLEQSKSVLDRRTDEYFSNPLM